MKQNHGKEGTMRTWKRIAAFICAFLMLGWVLCLFLTVFAKSDELTQIEAAETSDRQTKDGSLPGDDTPALVSCSMEDVQEDYENELIEAALMERATVIENCTVTYYTIDTCGKSPQDHGYGITSSGFKAVPYVTCAVDRNLIPEGATVMIDFGDGELQYWRAFDSGVSGNHVDLCVESVDEALQLGRRTATVYWCEEG